MKLDTVGRVQTAGALRSVFKLVHYAFCAMAKTAPVLHLSPTVKSQFTLGAPSKIWIRHGRSSGVGFNGDVFYFTFILGRIGHLWVYSLPAETSLVVLTPFNLCQALAERAVNLNMQVFHPVNALNTGI